MILIAAAGTGGHIYPALAVAEALEAKGVSSEQIAFITSSRPIEDRIFSDTRYRRVALSIGGLTGGSIDKVLGLIKITWAALTLGKKLKLSGVEEPQVLIMFGGYISAVARVGLLFKVNDVVVVETNSVMGRANRFFRIGAKATFNAFSSKNKSSGVPLRRSALEALSADTADRNAIISTISDTADPYDRFIVAFGGSLGARTINQSVLALVESGDVGGGGSTLVYLVVGQRDFAQFVASRKFPLNVDGVTLSIAEYDNDLIEKLKVADVVISRAGSNTVAELAALGKAAVLIPLPNSPNDHQTKNALWYLENGRGVVLVDSEVNSTNLRRAISSALGRAVEELGKFDEVDAASKISVAVLSLIESL
ncbi:MAG: glycosyltransferase [Actinomycetota bacterium]|nr:glycosyltransferase [Actinomycetota bacterium]